MVMGRRLDRSSKRPGGAESCSSRAGISSHLWKDKILRSRSRSLVDVVRGRRGSSLVSRDAWVCSGQKLQDGRANAGKEQLGWSRQSNFRLRLSSEFRSLARSSWKREEKVQHGGRRGNASSRSKEANKKRRAAGAAGIVWRWRFGLGKERNPGRSPLLHCWGIFKLGRPGELQSLAWARWQAGRDGGSSPEQQTSPELLGRWRLPGAISSTYLK